MASDTIVERLDIIEHIRTRQIADGVHINRSQGVVVHERGLGGDQPDRALGLRVHGDLVAADVDEMPGFRDGLTLIVGLEAALVELVEVVGRRGRRLLEEAVSGRVVGKSHLGRALGEPGRLVDGLPHTSTRS